MVSRTRHWPADGEVWPTHGTAASDRNDAAVAAMEIEQLLKRLVARAGNGELTRVETLFIAAQVQQLNSKILRLLERNGAPTRPR